MSLAASWTRRRVVAGVVGAAYVALATLLVQDVLTGAGYQVTPVRTHRLADVAASIGRARGVNPIIAVAAVDAGGRGTTLQLPEGYPKLLAREADVFVGGTSPTLNAGLIDPFLGGLVRVAEYDPVLDQADAAAIEADAETVKLPMDVWAVAGRGSHEVVRLYTDPTRMRIYIAPPAEIGGASR